MQSNIAARAGRWSAQHRKIAIFGWLAFVIAATVLGSMVGQRTLTDAETGNGDSKVAEQRIDAAGFPDDAAESVLVQGKGSVKAGDPAFTAAVKDVTARLKQTAHVEDVKNPLAKGNEGQLSKDGRSALVSFEIAGDDDQALDRVDATLAATVRGPEGQPGRAHRAVRRRVGRQGPLRRLRGGLPAGRGALAADHARDPRRGLRRARGGRHAAAARPERRRGDDRAARAAVARSSPSRSRSPRWSCSSASRSASTTRCSTCGANARSVTPGAVPRRR